MKHNDQRPILQQTVMLNMDTENIYCIMSFHYILSALYVSHNVTIGITTENVDLWLIIDMNIFNCK